jgi:hypothetical protein
MTSPWKCPACQSNIRSHQVTGQLRDEPATGVVYRCHICRLELVYDPISRALQVPPLDRGSM